MKLIIIIPAYNEEQTIGKVIKEIPKSIDGVSEIKIFVINDGSTDKTVETAIKAGANKIINNNNNIGLARAFQKGLSSALADGADIIVNTDADGQYNQAQIKELIKPIIKKRADIVIGNRQVRKLEFMPLGNKYGNLIGSWVLRCLSGAKVTDASSGFRAFQRSAAMRINIRSNHTYTHETIIQAAFNGITIAEIPIEFRPRQAGKSKLIQGLFKHIKNSFLVIIRTILLYKPLKTLFYLGTAMMLPGIILCLRFIYFYLISQGGGKIQSLVFAAILIITGFFVIMIGLLGDLIANNRRLNENILYLLKKNQRKK